jgi:hypothetical protein
MAKKTKKKAAGIKLVVGDIRAMSLKNDQRILNAGLTALDTFAGKPDFSDDAGITPLNMMAGIVLQSVIEAARNIVRTEWHLQYASSESKAKHSARWLKELEEEKAMFARQYKAVKAKFGESFEKAWKAVLEVDRECARAGLQGKGMSYYYVLPDFNEDGTHSPVDIKDGPWGQIGRV